MATNDKLGELEEAGCGPLSKKPRLEASGPDFLGPGTPVDDMDDLYGTPPLDQTPQGFVSNHDKPADYQTETFKPTSAIPGLGLLSSQRQTARDLHSSSGKEQNSNNDSTANGYSDAGHRTPLQASPDAEPLQNSSVANGSQVILNGNLFNGAAADTHRNDLEELKVSDAAAELHGLENRGNEVAQLEKIPAAGEAQGEAEWEIDSSPLESDTSADSSSTSDEEDDDYKLLDPEEQARILMQGDGGSDDENDASKPGKAGAGTQVKTKNEITEDKVEKPNVAVTAEMKIEELGIVEKLVGNLIVIKANTSGEYQVLESGSVLCLQDRSVIGVVAETLGRVQQPYYAVRFDSKEEIAAAGISIATTVFYVPLHSTYVFTKTLQAMKGSDASNLHDEEVGDDEMEFSDDEAEAEYRRKIKQQKLARRGGRSSMQRSSQQRTDYTPAVQGLAYDDAVLKEEDDEDGELYTPLARPSNFHEIISGGDTFRRTEPPRGASNRGHPGRGRTRGRGGGGRRGPGKGRGSHNYSQGRHTRDYRPDNHTQQVHLSNPDIPQVQAGSCYPQHPGSGIPTPHQYNMQPGANFLPQQVHAFENFSAQPLQSSYGYSPFPPRSEVSFAHPPSQSAPLAALSPGGALPAGSFVNPAFFRSPQSTPMRTHLSPPPQQTMFPAPTMSGYVHVPSDADAAFRAAQEKLDILRYLGQQGSGSA